MLEILNPDHCRDLITPTTEENVKANTIGSMDYDTRLLWCLSSDSGNNCK